MGDLDLIVRNADIATAADRYQADIGVRGGRIVTINEVIRADALRIGGHEIDAAGRLVTPGGVDSHCHLDQPMTDGSTMADDFESGTRSAAAGGTTTVIPFACQLKGQSMFDVLADYHRRASGKALVDYAYHMIVSDPNDEVIGKQMPALIQREGVTSFKLYMTYEDLKLNDAQIIRVLATAKREGAMTMVHAENFDCIEWLTARLLEAGIREPIGHALSRPQPVEREATHRAISLSELLDTPILLVHVSAREAIEQIRWGQGRGLSIYGETCPQYLFLTDESLEGGYAAASCICSPPPRDEANRQAVWDGLENGTFHVVSSDHAPFRSGPDGKTVSGDQPAFNRVPNGIPGIETRLPLLMSAGVMGGRIDVHRFVALTATNAARLYGLYPRKGTIAIGSDADMVIWDQDKVFTLSNAMLHHNVDYTPYEGMQLMAWPAYTIARGDVVWQGRPGEGTLMRAPGRGQFLRCERPATAKSAVRPDAQRGWISALMKKSAQKN
jgi:dihydropyrimidinase